MTDRDRSSDPVNTRREDDIGRWNDEGGARADLDTDAAATLTAEERDILERLGAAVVLEWDAMPTDLKRTLFKLASANGGTTSGVTALSTAIARFLHDHGNAA